MIRLLKFYLRKKGNKKTRAEHLREIINYEDRWEWKKLVDTFDKFIDKLYCIPDENKEEFNEKVDKFYHDFVEMIEGKK